MNRSLAVSGVVAFGSCWLLLKILSRVAGRVGLVDRPGGHKVHDAPTPLVGGIAMFIAFSLAVLLLDVPLSPFRMLFVGALILVVVGVLDDLRELSPKKRFGAQIVASLLMAAGAGVELRNLGSLLSPEWVLSLGVFAVPVTVFATVGVINAMNMSDGLDGLAASVALVTLSALGVLAWWADAYRIANILLLVVLVLLPFLARNLRWRARALVFMGDAGSMFLGFTLAWFLIQCSQGENRLMAPVTALWIFALPLLDAITTMVRRMTLGRSPFLGDQEHFHHMLLAAGLGPKQTLALMFLLALAAAAVGLAGEFLGAPEHWMFLGFLALFGLHFWIVTRAWRVNRLRHHVCPQARSLFP